VGCVQEAKVFCCFNSKLARIVQEQGRPQLATFNPPWVYAGSGNCRGFTPSEFQMLDFSKMDLSEYLGDIKAKAQATLQNTINDKINQYYQKTQP
jgi:conjugal transfer mating pair stabilization protein TraN